MPTLTGSFPSRIGFKGSEDLGGGMQALFVLENGLSLDTGTQGQGNRLFGRQANVGLKTAFGTFTLGRQVNMTYISMLKADIMGPNLYGMSNMDGYLPNSRSDNAIGYMGKFGDVSVGGTYSFGRDASNAGGPAATNCGGEVPGDSQACRQVTALLAYDTKTFGVATAYDKLNGGTGAAGGLTNSDYNVKRISLNGYVFVGQAKVGLGMIQRKTHTATDTTADLHYLGVSYPFAKNWVLDTQVARFNEKDIDDGKSTQFVARATYNFSKRTAAYVSAGHISNEDNARISISPNPGPANIATGESQTGVMVGLLHRF